MAVVGASEGRPRSDHAVPSLLASGLDVHLVNPARPSLYGVPSYPSLSAIGVPVDCAFVMVNATLAVDAVAEAAQLGVGGVVVNAGGYREVGGEGVELERQLVAAAGDSMAMLGPNCNGFIDVNRGVRISGAPLLPIRAGSIALVTHSGALMGSVGLAGFERAIGFSHLISTGNEATIDMADCIEFLVDDPATRAICLVVEAIRRPVEFFEAVRRAERAGKPVVALKLGRSAKGREIAMSHTAAVAEDAWVYEQALRQHGVSLAHDLLELVDRVICFDQLTPERWSPLGGLAVLSPSGGGAELAADVMADLGVELPELPDVKERLTELLPGVRIANPIDMTGFVVGNREFARNMIDLYVDAPEVDTVVLHWFVDDAAYALGSSVLDAYADKATATTKTMMLGSLDDGRFGERVASFPERGIAIARGLVSTVRALRTMGDFVARQHHDDRHDDPVDENPVGDIATPGTADWIDCDGGPILSFGAAMHLLAGCGVPVAPYLVVGAAADPCSLSVGFEGPYAVKLADVPHRTEIGAVEVGVPAAGLIGAIRRLRELAATHAVPEDVVVQPAVPGHGEAFVGVQGDSPLGQLVVCGVGGIFLEVLHSVVGALVPVSRHEVVEMLHGLDGAQVFRSVRGRPPWDKDALADLVVAVAGLAHRAEGWLRSLDINPLIVSPEGFVAVDALVVGSHDTGRPWIP